MMGGTKIFVPKEWNIILDTNNIMGDSKDQGEDIVGSDNSKTLRIDGTIIMGGLEVVRK